MICTQKENFPFKADLKFKKFLSLNVIKSVI